MKIQLAPVFAFLGVFGCSAQEVDPVYAAGAAAGISSSDIDRWNEIEAVSEDQIERWDSALQVELDPVFEQSAAAAIDVDSIARWDDTFSRAESDGRYRPQPGPQAVSIGPTNFVSRFVEPDLDYLGGQGVRVARENSVWILFAPVQLPHGAVVSGMDCYLSNNDTTESVSGEARLNSYELEPGSPLPAILTVDMTAGTAAGSLKRSTTGTVLVNNFAHHHALELTLTVSGTSSDFFDPVFHGCTIRFTSP